MQDNTKTPDTYRPDPDKPYAELLADYRANAHGRSFHEFVNGGEPEIIQTTTTSTSTTTTTTQKRWEDRVVDAATGASHPALRSAYKRAEPKLYDATERELASKAPAVLAAHGLANISELFGMGARGKLANKIAQEHPEQYKILQAAARQAGIIA